MNIDFDYFEKMMTRQAMVDSSYLNSIADFVKPEFFENKIISKYFKIIKEFYDKRQKLPTPTEVNSYLESDAERKKFKELILSFKELDKNLDKDELYENTEKFLKEKSVYNTLLSVASEISEGEVNTSDILSKFETACNINLVTDRGIELFKDVDLLIDDIINIESTISSGWDWFDSAMRGGFREDGKALYMFAGQANIGKSIVLGNVAVNLAKQNKTVLVITLEMSEMLYAKRMSSKISNIPMKDMYSSSESLKEMLIKERKKLKNGKIYIKEFPPSTITPKQLSAFIKKFEDSGEKIDAIVIDYINLLHSSLGSNSYERVKYICEQVRAMSYTFNCPIISATQLNRSSFNTSNPGMEGLSESIGIAATADVIVSIFQNEEDQELDIIRFGMMKNRFGPRGMVQPMKIDYPTLNITETDEECEDLMPESETSLLEKFSN